jgi:hypothetical protein
MAIVTCNPKAKILYAVNLKYSAAPALTTTSSAGGELVYCQEIGGALLFVEIGPPAPDHAIGAGYEEPVLGEGKETADLRRALRVPVHKEAAFDIGSPVPDGDPVTGIRHDQPVSEGMEGEARGEGAVC